jgi:hypothetical protein
MERPKRADLPLALAALAVLALGPLLLWNVSPAAFGADAHDRLAPLPLGLVAASSLLHQLRGAASRIGRLRAVMLSVGFCLWAATQLWPAWPHALRLNDLAIALFVLEIFLGVRRSGGRPAAADVLLEGAVRGQHLPERGQQRDAEGQQAHGE